MKKYKVFIDVAQDEDWQEIEVESDIVEAETPQQAEEIVTMSYGNSDVIDFYVWEVTEEDAIN